MSIESPTLVESRFIRMLYERGFSYDQIEYVTECNRSRILEALRHTEEENTTSPVVKELENYGEQQH